LVFRGWKFEKLVELRLDGWLSVWEWVRWGNGRVDGCLQWKTKSQSRGCVCRVLRIDEWKTDNTWFLARFSVVLASTVWGWIYWQQLALVTKLHYQENKPGGIDSQV
jgi:hypothetical protein